MDEIPFRAPRPLKQETVAHVDRLSAQIRVYALALLLATAISALHACILFGLADFFTLFKEWAKTALEPRPADILVVITAISALFAAHIAETAIWAVFFWKSGQLGSFGDGWYFAGASHTTLGYGTWCFRNRGGAWVPSARSMACSPLDVQRRFSFYCCKASDSARFDQMPLQHTES